MEHITEYGRQRIQTHRAVSFGSVKLDLELRWTEAGDFTIKSGAAQLSLDAEILEIVHAYLGAVLEARSGS